MFIQPKPITQEQVRNGQYRSADFAPPLWQIPSRFTSTPDAWGHVASTLMWAGSSAILSAVPRPSIDRDQALLHVGAVLLAIDLTVEHREAAAAYLLSEWFESIATANAYASHRSTGGEPSGDIGIPEGLLV